MFAAAAAFKNLVAFQAANDELPAMSEKLAKQSVNHTI